MLLFSSRGGGFCPLSPAVTIPVDSHHPRFLLLFPTEGAVCTGWNPTHPVPSLLMSKPPLCLTFRLALPVSDSRDSKLLCTIFGQNRMNSNSSSKRVREDGQQGASAGSLTGICAAQQSDRQRQRAVDVMSVALGRLQWDYTHIHI